MKNVITTRMKVARLKAKAKLSLTDEVTLSLLELQLAHHDEQVAISLKQSQDFDDAKKKADAKAKGD